MPHPITSHKRAQVLSTSLFLFAIVALIITDDWWPGIMLALGLPLALRQYLLGRTYDMGVTLLVFVGTFVTVQYDISWRLFLPVLFTLGAIYILLREFFDISASTESEREQDKNEDLKNKDK